MAAPQSKGEVRDVFLVAVKIQSYSSFSLMLAVSSFGDHAAFKRHSSVNLHSTQWTGAKLHQDSGGAAEAETAVSTGQRDVSLWRHTHHTAVVCRQRRGVKVKTCQNFSILTFHELNKIQNLLGFSWFGRRYSHQIFPYVS